MPTLMRDLRRQAYEREHGRCLVTGHPLGEVDGNGWELHHRVPGGMGGTPWDRDTIDNVIAVLPQVHNLHPRSIHMAPGWSGPRGYLLPPRVRDPWAYPVLTWRGWAFLRPDGTVMPLDHASAWPIAEAAPY